MNSSKYYDHNKTRSRTMSVLEANHIILKPHITEKTFEMVESGSRICFIVSNRATKPQIRQAISVLYNTQAGRINTARTLYGKKAFVVFESAAKAKDLATDIGML